MSTQDELTDKERSIRAFAEADFIKRGMNRALAMIKDPDTKLINLLTVIGGTVSAGDRRNVNLSQNGEVYFVIFNGGNRSAPML